MTPPTPEQVAELIERLRQRVNDAGRIDYRYQYAAQDGPDAWLPGYDAELDMRSAATLAALHADNARLREALTPSGDTKAAYMGEFGFDGTGYYDDGSEYPVRQTVPWATIKEIMAAIRQRADATHPTLGDAREGASRD